MNPEAVDAAALPYAVVALVVLVVGVPVACLLEEHVRCWWRQRDAGPHRRALDALDRIEHRR